MNYEIIASTSAGNAVLIEDMLFDVGVPYSKIRDLLYGVKYIFITHIHGDHLNIKTVKLIQKEFPRILWIGNHEVASRIPLTHLVGDTTTLELGDRTVNSFPCSHDVVTHGFVVKLNDKRVIYATDTNNLDSAPPGPYDYLFIESNHDENKLNRVMGKSSRYGYDPWKAGQRHLSTQKSKAFYYINRRSPESVWVELHKSGRFY